MQLPCVCASTPDSSVHKKGMNFISFLVPKMQSANLLLCELGWATGGIEIVILNNADCDRMHEIWSKNTNFFLLDVVLLGIQQLYTQCSCAGMNTGLGKRNTSAMIRPIPEPNVQKLD